jgi:hypothetical protein
MAYRSVKSRLKNLSEKTSLDLSAKQQIRNRLEMEMAKGACEPSRASSVNIRRKLSTIAAVVIPLAVIIAGGGYWRSLHFQTPQKSVAVANNTPSNNHVKPPVPTTTKNATLRVGVSRMTANSGALSNFLHGSAVHSHQFSGSSGTGASVLDSVDRDGTLVAVNFNGDEYVTAPGYKSTLYFVPATSNTIQTIAKLNNDGPRLGVVTAAVLSSEWIAWTDFVPNGVMQNVGILNRATGESWYVVAPKDEQQFMKKALGASLFLRRDTLYMFASGTSMNNGSIQSYNMITKKWSTFYDPPADGSLQLLSFELTEQGAVVELTGGSFDTDVVVQLNKEGKQIGKAYRLPSGVLNLTGVSGAQVLFNGDRGSYEWTPGSSEIQEISNTSGVFSGVGERYLTGWDYSQQTSGQLLDMQTKTHYDFDASSAAVTSSKLYWTKGNTVYWAALPK